MLEHTSTGYHAELRAKAASLGVTLAEVPDELGERRKRKRASRTAVDPDRELEDIHELCLSLIYDTGEGERTDAMRRLAPYLCRSDDLSLLLGFTD